MGKGWDGDGKMGKEWVGEKERWERDEKGGKYGERLPGRRSRFLFCQHFHFPASYLISRKILTSKGCSGCRVTLFCLRR